LSLLRNAGVQFLKAVLVLSGMIIGVGMFGIPFSFAQSGFWLGMAELAILAVVVAMLHLYYAEIVLQTPGFHRLPGYARLWLGQGGGLVSQLSAFAGISGTLLAYILIGSRFLHNVAAQFTTATGEFFWATAVVVGAALMTIFPLKKEALFNGILTALLILFIIGLATVLLPQIEAHNLGGFRPENILIPYGVLLFALSGGTVIPDVITVLGKNRSRVRRAILAGSLLPAVLYVLFALAVVGVAGGAVSEEAIRGLELFAGEGVVLAGSVIGFLAVFTSLVALASSFQALMVLDVGLPHPVAWLTSLALPFILYLAGLESFIWIIGTIGAVALGIDALLVMAAHARISSHASKGDFIRLTPTLLIAGMVLVAMGYHLWMILSRS
jgi:tyrosine-specific transport protein